MKPLVSVVIPTYNRADDLRRALDSVVAQSYDRWQVLVVDNHSEDNTDEVIASYNDPRIQLYTIHNHGVIAASRNKGIQVAEGEYVAFLDSDDWWCDNKLAESVAHLEQGLDVVYHDLWLVTQEGQEKFTRTGKGRNVSKPVFQDLIREGNPLMNSSVVVRRALLEQIGYLSEDKALIAMEDYDAWLRIARLTDRFAKIPGVLGFYWMAGGNVTNPQNNLRALDGFVANYAEDIRECLGDELPWWFNYNQGRAYYLLGQAQKAKEKFSCIAFRQAPAIIWFKTLWMRLRLLLAQQASN